MPSKVIDTFEDLSTWTSFASGEARLEIFADQGPQGKAMGLAFDFRGSGGFVVARKTLELALPESYRFSFQMRGCGPPNIFEFKLADKGNENVWRYRVEQFDFPREWQPLTIRSPQIEFAWGPLGGGPARGVAALELVIAAGAGGRGRVWIADLRLHDDTYRLTPLVRASSTQAGYDSRNVVDLADSKGWVSEGTGEAQWLVIDFQRERDLGGLVIGWEAGLQPKRFHVRLSLDGVVWSEACATTEGAGECSYVYLPAASCRYIRLDLCAALPGGRVGIRRIEVKPYDFSRSLDHFFQNVARQEPAGLYPKYLLGRQTYWTPTGTGSGDGQALMNEEGMVEVDKGSFSIAPFLYANDRLVTWADADVRQGLIGDCLPIPFSRWQTESASLKVTAFAGGEANAPVLFIGYEVQNLLPDRQLVTLFAAIVPFQVTPTWQRWRGFGGARPVRELSLEGGAIWVDRTKVVLPLAPARGFGAVGFAGGMVSNYLRRGKLPAASSVQDRFGYASGALAFELDLAPGATGDIYLAIPWGSADVAAASAASGRLREVGGAEWLGRSARGWAAKLGSVEFRLPPRARCVADTVKTAAAHILVNREGPALHPGPRRYSRAWIRDGAIMGAALLRLGHGDAARDFLRWYRTHQAEDGKIPDCVDGEGAEWLAEFDAYGQFIYAVMDYYRLSGEVAFLEEMWPAVAKTLAYMGGLRGQRLTPQFQRPEKRAFYGLLPESMSHEGYMAHPVHAYWDDFWAIRGLEDAAAMAEVLGKRAEAARLAALVDAFSEDVHASLLATIARHGIDFVPGSVELGDFDPSATAIAVALLDQVHLLPPAETARTFDKYLAGLRERAGGKTPWTNYSAYEIRIIGALVRLGRRREALELIKFMLADRRIPAWNQWPEISWRDYSSPSFLGDLPHAWIGAEYILATRDLFAYERQAQHSLVLAAGVPEEWLADGFAVGVDNLPTYYGKLSYWLWWEGGEALRLALEGDLVLPRGGIVVRPPLARPIRQVEIDGRASEEFTPDAFRLRECPAHAVVRF